MGLGTNAVSLLGTPTLAHRLVQLATWSGGWLPNGLSAQALALWRVHVAAVEAAKSVLPKPYADRPAVSAPDHVLGDGAASYVGTMFATPSPQPEPAGKGTSSSGHPAPDRTHDTVAMVDRLLHTTVWLASRYD